jgi:hypothetical protein
MQLVITCKWYLRVVSVPYRNAACHATAATCSIKLPIKPHQIKVQREASMISSFVVVTFLHHTHTHSLSLSLVIVVAYHGTAIITIIMTSMQDIMEAGMKDLRALQKGCNWHSGRVIVMHVLIDR